LQAFEAVEEKILHEVNESGHGDNGNNATFEVKDLTIEPALDVTTDAPKVEHAPNGDATVPAEVNGGDAHVETVINGEAEKKPEVEIKPEVVLDN
jgi:hypothetical protein